VNSDERRNAFAEAFAAQGRSDWEVYKHLAGLSKPSFPYCHSLHYLQMATEKIAKAYRIRDTGADVDKLAKGHAGFEEFVNSFFRCKTIRDEYAGKDAALLALQKNATTLAKEIEKLAPAIDNFVSPENAEYPWERDGSVYRPCLFDYPNLFILKQPAGRAVMNLIQRAFQDFEALHID
jgi:hypothetical protein